MLRIGPTAYRVEYVDDPRINGTSTDGVIDPEESVIKIGAYLPRDRAAVVLWHEILHGIEIDRNISLTEREVDSLARGIVAMLIDNPEWLPRLAPIPNSGLRHP